MKSNLLLEQYSWYKKQQLAKAPFECLLNADIEPNPHQVNAFCAAIQALKTGGIILADEVGLGKTIEAGLVLNYVLDNGAKKVLISLPVTLRKQWEVELLEKFGRQAVILDRYTVEHDLANVQTHLGNAEEVSIVIASYDYSSKLIKRFPHVKWDFLIIDEAHNLVERSREMYSAEIYKEDFLAVKKIVKRYRPGLEQQFNHCNRILLEYKRECEKYKVYDNIGNLMFYLMKLASELDEFLQRSTEFPERKEVSEFYFGLRNFINIYERVDEHYVIYTEHMEDERFKMKLYCVDPSLNLQECIDRGNSAIFFSATFLPIQYYKNLLSTKKDNYAVYAETAFSEEQSLLLMGSDVSSRYTRRKQSEFERIAQYIQKTGLAKKGNYMVFFPSYKMMQQVYEVFQELDEGTVEIIIQEPGMNEEKREAFLAEFSAERKKTVMGGIFGEGIDLKKEQLIGAVIVGTGLPQISNEREILMDYYEKRMGEGFDYAYRYPGMNKVLQAAGRVIRTIDDVGVIELLDERFLQSDYRNLFPKEWEKRLVCTVDSVDSYLEKFWEEKQ